MGLTNRLRRGWNAFMNKDPTYPFMDYGMGSSYRPDRVRLSRGHERSIITSIFNKIALDVASVNIMHVRLDGDGRFLAPIDSGLNACLTLSANIDQTARSFIQDAVLSMFDEGCVALVPVDTDLDPKLTTGYDILSMRTGRVVTWYPNLVRLSLYNDRSGRREEITLPKESVAIVENPFYAVMNEPNSTLQRLIRKLNILDAIDEQSGSGKMDLIVQLPYLAKTTLKKREAESRLRQVEEQLRGSKYGIAYLDATEKVIQLNRPVENNMMTQIEYLTNTLYGQLGITQSIMDGTADEKTMRNYMNRTVEQIVSAIVDEMKRTFLSKKARTQGQSIMYFNDPFKLVPATEFGNLANSLKQSEILSSNELRQLMGLKPVQDPRADKLLNSNINKTDEASEQSAEPIIEEEENQNEV